MVVVGADFRFGHQAAGDVTRSQTLGDRARLRRSSAVDWSAASDAPVLVLHRRYAPASDAGDVAGAAEVLGRPHRVEGVVVHGDHRGRELGFPTANLDVDARRRGPGRRRLRRLAGPRPTAQRLPAAISVGTNPTFDGAERRVEAYVLDRDDLDLYGEQVAVDSSPAAARHGAVRLASTALRRPDDRRRRAAALPPGDGSADAAPRW